MRIGILIIILVLLSVVAVYSFRSDIPYLNNFFAGETVQKKANPKKVIKPPNSTSDSKESVQLDEKTRKQIEEFIKGIHIKPGENNVKYAIRLDHSVGRKQVSQGKYKDAYNTYKKILAISYNNGSLHGISIGLGMIAYTINLTGDKDKAFETYLLSYKVNKILNKREELGVIELSIANLLAPTDRALSLAWLLKAKNNLKGTKYKEDYISLLSQLGKNLEYESKVAESEEIYLEAWENALLLGIKTGQKWSKWTIGKNYSDFLMKLGKYDQALNIIKQSLNTFNDKDKQSGGYTDFLYRIADTYSLLNQPELAEQYYQSAYTNYEILRTESLGDSGRAELDYNFTDENNRYLKFLVENNKYMDALVLLESNKARTLNDIMQDVYQKDVYEKLSDLKIKHEQERNKLNAINEDNIETPAEDQMQRYMDLWKKQQKEKGALEISLNIRKMPVSKSISAIEINNIQKQLPNDVAIISYFISEKFSGAFVIDNSKKQFIKLDQNSKYFIRLAKELSASLINPYTDFYLESSEELYNNLFLPLEKQLAPSIRQIVISSDSILSAIPFSPLFDGKTYLVEKFSIYRIPSLRFIKNISDINNKPLKQGLACVDPEISGARLPFQAETGEFLNNLYKSDIEILSGKKCSTTDIVKKINAIDSPSFLHIGAHGRFYPENPMESAIYLSNPESPQGKLLTAQDIATTDLSKIPLITLSSCETGLSDIEKYRDVFGILRALLFAGSKSVIAPLWAVQDNATSSLIQNFYKNYSSGNNALIALQKAQISAIRNDEYKHPFYWSGYIFTGVML
jgi:CHAT domain-containing protein